MNFSDKGRVILLKYSDFRGTSDYLREVKATVSHTGKAVLPTKTIRD